MAKLSVEQALLRADGHVRKGEHDSARALYDAVLAAFPKNVRAQQGLARLNAAESDASANHAPPKEKIDALIATYNQNRFQDVVDQAQALADEYPYSFVIWNILAAGQKALGRLAEAEKGFRKAIALNPNDANSYNNFGIALKNQGKVDEAILAYQRTLELNPTHSAVYYNLGLALEFQSKQAKAILAYQRAIEINPTLAEAHSNIGNILANQGKQDEAILAYQRAIEINPTLAEASNNIGNILAQQYKFNEALLAYQDAITFQSIFPEAYYNLGNTLRIQGRIKEAIFAYQRVLEQNSNHAKSEANILHQKQHICDFTVSLQLYEASARLGISTADVSPFLALTWADAPQHHIMRAISRSLAKYKQPPIPLPARPKKRPERLKIGYLSADFHDHATMYLMSGLLRQHDRTSIETYAYSYGRSKSGDWRKRAENDVDHFFDVTDHSDRQVVDLVRSHALDIAIDLKGYTQHTRSQVFQYRLAPLQINYLGYPGTMGASFIDYIIADPVVIPAEQRQYYSENVIYLPHSYQPNDNERPIVSTSTTRSDVDLPEYAFVFCCFNNSYKISPTEFDIWMRLLKKVNDSVLWLLRSNEWAEINLRKEAAARGVDPSRLVFAPKLPPSEHLARHRHADLFIDTFNVNAHTTASDALWSGLPVVTKLGKQFAARVAASLLTAVGLPELITETEEEYEQLILELAMHPAKLRGIKTKLAESRLKAPLFDTIRYTRNFERGLTQAYNLYLNGKEPEDIWVTEDDV
jgi:protein O-GlcNAc transferase